MRDYPVSWLFWASMFMAMLLLLLPWPLQVAMLKPYWPILILMFWIMEAPSRVSIGIIFLFGLMLDVVHGYLLGDQALRLVLVVYLVQKFRAQLRFFPMWQQTLVVLALLINDTALRLIIAFVSRQSMPSHLIWLSAIIGAVLWPFVFLLLDRLFTRLRVRES